MSREDVRREFFKQRFWLSCFFAGTATGFVVFDKMSGGEYVAAISAILGLWGLAAWREYRQLSEQNNAPK